MESYDICPLVSAAFTQQEVFKAYLCCSRGQAAVPIEG